MRRRWTAVGVCLTFALAIGAAQQPSAPPPDSIPSFRSGIDIVELDVSVLGKDRMPVHGLTAADFTVIEDGKPQPIVAFDAVDLPDVNRQGAAWLREIAPDVATNRRDAQRVVMILLDDCDVPFEDTTLSKRVAHAVVEELGPSDMAAVIYTFMRRDGQEFTIDRTRLGAAIDRLGTHPLPHAQPVSSNAAERSGEPEVQKRFEKYSAGNTAQCTGDPLGQALRNAAEVMRPWPGARKTLVLIPGAGFSQRELEERGPLNPTQKLFADLQEANINVYEYDSRGLQTNGRIHFGFGTLADNTGGRAISATNTPWTLVPQMFRENSSCHHLLRISGSGFETGRTFSYSDSESFLAGSGSASAFRLFRPSSQPGAQAVETPASLGFGSRHRRRPADRRFADDADGGAVCFTRPENSHTCHRRGT